jgi:hypothetical protein
MICNNTVTEFYFTYFTAVTRNRPYFTVIWDHYYLLSYYFGGQRKHIQARNVKPWLISKLLTNHYFSKFNLLKTLIYNIYVGCLKYYKVLAILFYYIVVATLKGLDICETIHLLSPTAREWGSEPTIRTFDLRR